MTNPSRARRPGTAGCPSTEVSPGAVGAARTGGEGAAATPTTTSPPSFLAPTAPNACDLNCLAVGHNFYYTFGRVLDGTRCGPDSSELCVGGRCMVGVRGDGTPRTPRDPLGPSRTLGPCPDAASWLLRASAAMGSWARVRGPTPVAGAAAARTGASWCTGSSRARSPPPVNEPLPRPPPWVNALALGSPVPPPRPVCVPKASPGSPRIFCSSPRSPPGGIPGVSLWSVGSPGVFGGPWVHPEAAPCPSAWLQSPPTAPLLTLRWSQPWHPPPHDAPSAVPGLCPDSPPAPRLFWVHERDQDPGWGHQHQGDRQEPQLPRPNDERRALRAQRGLVHRLAGAVRGGRHPAALRPEPRRHREPGGGGAHGRGSPRAGRCGRCRPPKGRSQRIRHFCQSDFVFRAQILARRSVGQETRYEVQVQTPYRHRFPLVPREYVWVPDACGCPPLLEGREYLLMARRHVNYEHTLNRILLQRDGYARPWSPREDRLVREAARHCAPPRPP
uniref:NTR domain-containing protein n=1 Tax=Anas platyrhynchos platyrhynchos TaxID=8840 RepID=A0A493T4G8_ANAPP